MEHERSVRSADGEGAPGSAGLRRRHAVGWRLAAATLGGYLFLFHPVLWIPESLDAYSWTRWLLFRAPLLAAAPGNSGGRDSAGARPPSDGTVALPAGAGPGLPAGSGTEAALPPPPLPAGTAAGPGSAVLWAPFVAGAEAAARAAGAAASPPGLGRAHLAALATGSVVCGLGALLLALVAARRVVPHGAAALAVAALGFGTPYVAHLYRHPTLPHLPAALAVALALLATLRARRGDRLRWWLAAGAAVGFAAAVRMEQLSLVLLPLLTAGFGGNRAARARRTASLTVLGGFVSMLGLQAATRELAAGDTGIAVWARGFDLLRPDLGRVLLSGAEGLLPWAPLAAVGVWGLALLARRDPALGSGCAAVLGLQVWLAACGRQGGGPAAGPAFLVDLAPLLAVGLAVGFERLRLAGRSLPGWISAVAMAHAILLSLGAADGHLPWRPTGVADLLANEAQVLAGLPGRLAGLLLRPFWDLQTAASHAGAAAVSLDPTPGWACAVAVGVAWIAGLAALTPLLRLAGSTDPGGAGGHDTPARAAAPGPRRRRQPALRRGLRRITVRLILRLLDATLGFLPWRWVLRFGRLLGRTAYFLQPRRRRRARQNLARAFGRAGRQQLRDWESRVFTGLGMNLAEICWVAGNPRRIDRLVEFEGLEHLQAARREGRGVVLVTGHLGSWELMAGAIVRRGVPLSVIAREAPDGRVNEFVVGLRDRLGVRTVLRGGAGAAREILRTLRSGGVLGALIDQDTRVEGVFVDFFGAPAYTPSGPAALAVRARAPVVMGATWRLPDGRHRIRFDPPWRLEAGPEREAALQAHTGTMTRWLEDRIREHPDQWVWIHRRWRRAPTPGGGPR